MLIQKKVVALWALVALCGSLRASEAPADVAGLELLATQAYIKERCAYGSQLCLHMQDVIQQLVIAVKVIDPHVLHKPPFNKKEVIRCSLLYLNPGNNPLVRFEEEVQRIVYLLIELRNLFLVDDISGLRAKVLRDYPRYIECSSIALHQALCTTLTFATYQVSLEGWMHLINQRNIVSGALKFKPASVKDLSEALVKCARRLSLKFRQPL